jgi:nucleoid-associated protein YgaU
LERLAVVPRKPKLIAAAAVLAVGACLALPWRRGEMVPATGLPITTPTSAFDAVPKPPESIPATPVASVTAMTLGLVESQQKSDLVSTGGPQQSLATANRTSLESLEAAELTPTALPLERPEQTHVVHPGDSLERLAKRYLGDEGRAIEIFDLNREILENPHLLPIGAELKIPIVEASVAGVTP